MSPETPSPSSHKILSGCYIGISLASIFQAPENVWAAVHEGAAGVTRTCFRARTTSSVKEDGMHSQKVVRFGNVEQGRMRE